MERNNENIKLRKALPEDVPVMMELIRELAVFEKAPDEVTVTEKEFYDSGFGSKPVWEAYLAEIQGEETWQVAGMALYYIRYSTWKGRMLYLEDIVVRESYRGHGIGRFLMDQLIEVAKEAQYSGMMWQVLDWNKEAIDFYKKNEGLELDDSWVNVKMMF